MKNVTCALHGSDLRPNLCNDCARVSTPALPPSRVIRLTADDFEAIEKVYDPRGGISFRQRRPIAVPTNLDVWARA